MTTAPLGMVVCYAFSLSLLVLGSTSQGFIKSSSRQFETALFLLLFVRPHSFRSFTHFSPQIKNTWFAFVPCFFQDIICFDYRCPVLGITNCDIVDAFTYKRFLFILLCLYFLMIDKSPCCGSC